MINVSSPRIGKTTPIIYIRRRSAFWLPTRWLSLDIVRSYSTESLYGWLNFTTQLQFAGEQSLQVFKQQYPDCAVKALPVLPGSLGFDVPIDYHSELYGRHYDTTWYSAQCSQFIILLNAASTQLIERTLLDETIGFNARLDGFVEGVSPRLAYRVEFDARALLLAPGRRRGRCPCRGRYRDCLSLRRADPLPQPQPHPLAARHRPTAAGERSGRGSVAQSGFARSAIQPVRCAVCRSLPPAMWRRSF